MQKVSLKTFFESGLKREESLSEEDIFLIKEGNTALSLEKTARPIAKRKQKPKIKQPPLYKVILLNDDFTPMEFVVYILINFFNMDSSKATHLMLQIHTRGKGICGVFSKEIAETKVKVVNKYAREHKHPLLCVMEED